MRRTARDRTSCSTRSSSDVKAACHLPRPVRLQQRQRGRPSRPELVAGRPADRVRPQGGRRGAPAAERRAGLPGGELRQGRHPRAAQPDWGPAEVNPGPRPDLAPGLVPAPVDPDLAPGPVPARSRARSSWGRRPRPAERQGRVGGLVVKVTAPAAGKLNATAHARSKRSAPIGWSRPPARAACASASPRRRRGRCSRPSA